jgi:hypothetical protein
MASEIQSVFQANGLAQTQSRSDRKLKKWTVTQSLAHDGFWTDRQYKKSQLLSVVLVSLACKHYLYNCHCIHASLKGVGIYLGEYQIIENA